MPLVTRPGAEIYYEEFGAGYPLMIFAPGGLRSRLEFWKRQAIALGAPKVWIDPTTMLADKFRIIAMDQRSAPEGQTRGALTAETDWIVFAEDQLAVADHLKLDRFHIMGGCIGSSFCLKLCEIVSDRVSAAVLQNPIGLGPDNAAVFPEEFKRWTAEYRAVHPEADLATLEQFRLAMYDHDFVFSVTRDFVKRCRTPLLVMPGTDAPHPTVIGEEIARIAPNAEIMREWKGEPHIAKAAEVIRAFLEKHTPKT
jgi:pimeloyl-ACP methyl ester carboxylesterase